jgi:hypothetical protein
MLVHDKPATYMPPGYMQEDNDKLITHTHKSHDCLHPPSESVPFGTGTMCRRFLPGVNYKAEITSDDHSDDFVSCSNQPRRG